MLEFPSDIMPLYMSLQVSSFAVIFATKRLPNHTHKMVVTKSIRLWLLNDVSDMFQNEQTG